MYIEQVRIIVESSSGGRDSESADSQVKMGGMEMRRRIFGRKEADEGWNGLFGEWDKRFGRTLREVEMGAAKVSVRSGVQVVEEKLTLFLLLASRTRRSLDPR